MDFSESVELLIMVSRLSRHICCVLHGYGLAHAPERVSLLRYKGNESYAAQLQIYISLEMTETSVAERFRAASHAPASVIPLCEFTDRHSKF
jgi:hypothetical protein